MGKLTLNGRFSIESRASLIGNVRNDVSVLLSPTLVLRHVCWYVPSMHCISLLLDKLYTGKA